MDLFRPSPRLLCTATKQKNNGQNLEEDVGQNEQKPDTPSPEKILLDEKVKLEEQLKETVVRSPRLLWGNVICWTQDLWPDEFGHLSENYSQVLQQIPAEEGTRTGILCGTGSVMRIIFTCCTDYAELRLEGSFKWRTLAVALQLGLTGRQGLGPGVWLCGALRGREEFSELVRRTHYYSTGRGIGGTNQVKI